MFLGYMTTETITMTHEEQHRVVVLTSVRDGRWTAHEGGRFGHYDLAMLEGI